MEIGIGPDLSRSTRCHVHPSRQAQIALGHRPRGIDREVGAVAHVGIAIPLGCRALTADKAIEGVSCVAHRLGAGVDAHVSIGRVVAVGLGAQGCRVAMVVVGHRGLPGRGDDPIGGVEARALGHGPVARHRHQVRVPARLGRAERTGRGVIAVGLLDRADPTPTHEAARAVVDHVVTRGVGVLEDRATVHQLIGHPSAQAAGHLITGQRGDPVGREERRCVGTPVTVVAGGQRGAVGVGNRAHPPELVIGDIRQEPPRPAWSDRHVPSPARR